MHPRITKFFKKETSSNRNNIKVNQNHQFKWNLIFCKSQSNLDSSTEETQLISSSPTSLTTLSASSSLSLHFNASNSSVVTSSTSSSFKNDIGLYIGKPLSDEQKYELLTRHFEPYKQFVWPFKERITVTDGKKQL